MSIAANQQRLFLTGYRGTGKTTVAQRVAKQIGYAWVDADAAIVERTGCSIAELFANQGEAYFRDLEEEVVAELCQAEKQIVALGGGAILREATRKRLASAGLTVWLTAPADVLAQRIASDAASAGQRPSLTDLSAEEEVRKVLAEREPLYAASANHQVATEEKTPDEVAQAIVDWLKSE